MRLKSVIKFLGAMVLATTTDLFQGNVNFTSAIRTSQSQIPNVYGVFHVAGGWAIDGVSDYSYGTPPSGAFAITMGLSHYTGVHTANSSAASGYDFYASRCSDRYGSHTEVNPLYESCVMCIRY